MSTETTEAAPATTEPTTLTSTDGGTGGVSLTDGGTGTPAQPVAEVAPGISFPENWKEGLPEEFRSDPNMQHIIDVPALAKSYINAQKQIGADKIPVPGKHATEQDWQAIFQKLGNPSSIDEYQIEVPEDAGFDDDMLKSLKETAHKAGILPRQMNQLLSNYAAAQKVQSEEQSKKDEMAIQKGVDELKQEWGRAFDQEVGDAKQAIKYLNNADFNEWLDKSGLGNNPMLIKVFNKFGKLLKEDSIKGQSESGSGVMTPALAVQEINKIYGNPEHPFFDRKHPNHNNAVDEMQQLNKMAHPTDEQSQTLPGF